MSEEYSVGYSEGYQAGWNAAIDDCEQALAAPAKVPVAIISGIDEHGPEVDWYRHWVAVPIGTKLYTNPPAAQRQWVGLTNEEMDAALRRAGVVATFEALRCIIKEAEAKLKAKNT